MNRMNGGIPLIGQNQVQIQWVEALDGIPPLVGATAVVINGQPVFFGGMTKRLAVAASIMGPMLVNAFCTSDGNTDTIEQAVSKAALIAADALIATELADRTAKAE